MKKSIFKKLMTAILGFMFVLGITNYFNVQNVYASENVEFTVSVDSAKVNPGDNITYTVKMSGNDSGVALRLWLKYDTSKLELVSTQKGEVFDGATAADIYTNDKGAMNAVVASDSTLKNGTVFTGRFKVKDGVTGSAAVEVVNNELCDRDSDFLENKINNNATITITEKSETKPDDTKPDVKPDTKPEVKNGLYHEGSDWNYYVNGKIATDVTTLVKYNGSWWYVHDGKIDFGAKTLIKFNGAWWYVHGGKVDFGADTLCKFNGSWWYVQNGKVNFSSATLAKYSGSWWYVQNGKVNFSTTTLVKYNGTWWYVSGGKINFKATGLCKYNGTWWYIQNGKINFKAIGL